jgi:uncharacterized protein YaaN involved in tellurite resistance
VGTSLDALERDLPREISPEIAARIEATAVDFVGKLLAAPLGSAPFERSLRAIDTLGEREVAATTQIAARFHDRPVRAVEDVLADRAPLTRHLRDLRREAADLLRRAGRKDASVESLARDAADVEDRVRALVGALDADRQTLEVDNAAIDQQERALWIEIETLRQYAFLAARLDDLVAARVEALATEEPAAAHALQVEALYAVRRRRRDLLLQLAVATQGYAALRLVEQDNLEVIWAIRSATTTTVTALRTALLAARATADRNGAGQVGGAFVDELRETLGQMQSALDEVDRRRRTTLAEARRRPIA